MDTKNTYSSFAVRDIDAAAAFCRDKLGASTTSVMGGSVLDMTLPGSGTHVIAYQKGRSRTGGVHDPELRGRRR